MREQVQRFAVLMERRLRANDDKPGWQDDHPQELANFAMMIADVCGALPEVPS